jgi:hypothetical protein
VIHPDEIDLDDTGDVILLDLPARVEMVEGHRHPRLVPAHSGRWLAVLARNQGRDLRVVVSRAKQRRSSPQNRYLWGVVYVDLLEGMREKAVECGSEPPFDSVDSVHEWGKWKFLRKQRVLPGGEVEEVPGSTRCSLERFAEYVSQLASWGADRAIYVRQPHEERIAA